MKALNHGDVLRDGDLLQLGHGSQPKTYVPTGRIGDRVEGSMVGLYFRPDAPRTTRKYLPELTSLEANESKSTAIIDMVRRAIFHRPGTCEEIERRLALPHQSVSARIRDLSKRNEIRKSGNYRDTASGRRAIVWEAGSLT